MILDNKKEEQKENNHSIETEEKSKILTEKERREIIDKELIQYGYEMDPELVDIVTKEGDFEEWIDPLSNYVCRISRHVQFQTWNGYVRLLKNHPCFGKGYDDIDVNVHGGLTYSDGYFPSYTNNTPDGYWWIGFDTSHSWDRQPRIFIHFPSHLRFFERDIYRTKEYVTKEVTKLAKQLKDMEDLK